jgi:signal transduction histidine kinase
VIHRGWDGGPSLVASAHGDPNKQQLLRLLHGCVPDPDAPEGAPRVFRTGQVAVYSDLGDQNLMPGGMTIVGTRDPEHLRILRELGMRSLLCAPIMGRNGVDAVIMLVSGGDPHRYSAEDVVLAQDLAARTAVSLENGHLLFEALEAVKTRDDFLAVAAHELRTPLTSLTLHIQLLDRALRADRPALDMGIVTKGVSAAQHQARRLSKLVDGLLDVARVTNNRMSLRIEELDVRELLENVIAAMAQDFQRAGSNVVLTAPVRATVRWDRIRIEQVLTNLLSNAVKFGGGNPIEVSAEVTANGVQISVSDHGIGISKGDQSRIFGRFERAVSTRHFGGLGLGLYISAQILRTHQGSIRVESDLGEGARFIVDLPRGVQTSPSMTDTSTGAFP